VPGIDDVSVAHDRQARSGDRRPASRHERHASLRTGAIRSMIALAVFCQAASAAAAQTTIGILRFQVSPNVPPSAASSVEQFVYTEFAEQRRFRVLERSRIDAVQAERAVQQANSVLNPTALRDLGAQYVVLGEVTRAEVATIRGSQGAVGYHATIAYGLRIIDVSTGSVSFAQDFSTGRGNPLSGLFAGFTGDVTTPAGATDIAVRQTKKDLDAFIGKAFAISGRIVSVESSDDKGVPQTVLVSLGPADGVVGKTILSAYAEQKIDVNGSTLLRKRPLAELVFVESQGDHLSIFKVRKSSADLQAALAGGSPVLVEFKQ
jgi:curli biogenesis system outer membrane secretion channel CsgG